MISPDEVSAPHGEFYDSLFRQLNPFGKEEVEAASIAAFLKSAHGVNVTQLSQIWEIASELSGYKNRTALNKLGVYMCFKLVAAIQQGFPLTPNVLNVQLPVVPQFGIPSSMPTPPPQPPHVPPQFPSKSPSISSELAHEQQQTGGWPIGVEEQRKYDAIFDSLGPIGAKLSGDQCKPVLLNSQLPKTMLAKIWELADMDADGFLDRPEFCVALHLVYRALQNDPIPDRLPPALIPLSKRGLIRRMSTRSVDPTSSHPHPPPLSWSSRASSIASLNLPQQPTVPPAPPISPPVQQQMPIKKVSISLFDRSVNEWRVGDLAQYGSEFGRLDTDMDGLIGGADVRDVFLRSGLPQHTLARIWAHVDTAKAGKLDLEQYAKCVELIRECQRELNPQGTDSQGATIGTPSSPPVPAPNLARRDSQISTATNTSSTGGGGPKAENPRVAELNAEIEEIQQGRRKAEQDLFQSEADLKVKNSEIRNLEIELLTLNATVKQLKSQRVEANKRLNDLDTKIGKLEGLCVENRKRLEEDEARLEKTKADIQNAKENSQAEEELLAQLRTEVAARREKRDGTNANLRAENAKFEGFVDKLTQLERGVSKNEEECARMKADMAEMERILAGVEKGEEQAKKELAEKDFQRKGAESWAGSRTGSVEAPANKAPASLINRSAADAFGEPSADPFAPSGDDPFGPKTSGGQQPQQFANFANFSAFT